MSNNEGKVKTILICTVAIALIIISIATMTYAYFTSTRVSSNISLTSSPTFFNTVVYNSGYNVNGSIAPTTARGTETLKTTLSVASTTADAIASLMAQTDLSATTFLGTSGNSIMYEVYQKNSSSDDTISAICSNNLYTCGESTCYCQMGDFTNHLDGYPFELIKDYTLTSGDNYFDIYIWLDGNKSGNEVADKNLKVNFFFISTSSDLTVSE